MVLPSFASFGELLFFPCWVVLLGLFLLWVELLFFLSCSVVLLLVFGWCCVSPLLLRGAARFPPSVGGVAVFLSPVWWGCLPFPPLSVAVLSLVSFYVVLLGLLLLWVELLFFLSCSVVLLLVFGWCCVSPLLLRGAARFPPSVGGVVVFPFSFWWSSLPSSPLVELLFPVSSVGWCCLVSSFLGVVFLRKG